MENISAKKNKDTTLHPYTNGEEVFNWITHCIGAVFGLAVLSSCVSVSALNNNAWGIAGSIVYGVAMILLYTISTLYHALKPGKAKKVIRVIDHCTIYLLIAGTYTPILLSSVRIISPAAAFIIFGVEWGVAALAITLTAINMKKYTVFSMICYLVLGWAVLAIIPAVLKALEPAGFIFLLCGGIIYTIGAILYGLGKNHRYMHSVFHLFCLGGSFCQFITIIFYAL